jgi:hypothetical protein
MNVYCLGCCSVAFHSFCSGNLAVKLGTWPAAEVIVEPGENLEKAGTKTGPE